MEDKAKETIARRLADGKESIIKALREMPIVEVAAKRSGISRDTYYRWRREDPEFLKASDEALRQGKEFINDMSESQLIALIRDKKFPAIQLWLRQHHPDYGTKVELNARITGDGALTPEQEALVRKALGMATDDEASTNEKV